MRKLLIIPLILFGYNSFAQILNDTTVQFVGYWNINETQLYRVDFKKYTIEGQDTSSVESICYDSEVTIIDSSTSGYTIRWTYKNYDYQTNNKFTEKLMKIAQDMSIIYKTDELGVFQEIVNFEEIKSIIDKSIDTLAIEFKDIPNLDAILQQVRQTFTTKEAIETVGINEIRYFHTPFGAMYDINTTYNSETKLPNLYGGEPFDASIESEIVVVDTSNLSSVVKIFTTVDSEQLTNATFEYFKSVAKATNAPEPKRSDMPDLKMQTRYASNIHSPSGWVFYAIMVKEVISGDITNIESTELTLK